MNMSKKLASCGSIRLRRLAIISWGSSGIARWNRPTESYPKVTQGARKELPGLAQRKIPCFSGMRVFPIFAQIKSRRWTRYSDWPCLPVSTFPFLPVPLPSKWHTQFLPPIHVEEQFPPEAAQDASVVKRISVEVRTKMQQAVVDMLRRRRSIFFGSVFDSEEG